MTADERSGCLTQIMRVLGLKSAPEKKVESVVTSSEVTYPYHLRDNFLSKAELYFYHVLVKAVGDDKVICPKVLLRDVLYVSDKKNNMDAFYRISQKHLDFIVCDSRSMDPLLAIELDDASHQQIGRNSSDEIKNNALESAGLPLLRIKAARGYDVTELRAKLTTTWLAPKQIALVTIADENNLTTAPSCPKCGSKMVLRTATQGERKGEPFYGCSTYPQCRGIVHITTAVK
ncbi:MAG: DUF2726 domain-containing protein [Anaerolineae bacterium]|nr:DUF2726 domain-containing protein [Anaerolineae bacterium]